MATTDPMTPPRRSIRLPRPLWIGLATAALVVVGVGLRFGVPIYQQHAAIREIERLGGNLDLRPRGPKWLRNWVSDKRMKPFDVVDRVEFGGRPITDATLSLMG